MRVAGESAPETGYGVKRKRFLYVVTEPVNYLTKL